MRGIRALKVGSCALLLAAMPLLAGCASVDDALFGDDTTASADSDTGTQGSLPGTLPGAGTSDTGAMAGTLPDSGGSLGVGIGTTAPVTPITIEAGADTGTVVGRKVQELRTDLTALQGKIAANASQLAALRSAGSAAASSYHESRARITTRLEMGTTKGNPELVAEWNTAQSSLDSLTGNINQLNALGADIANDSSRAQFDLDTIQATFNVSGAVDDDHRQLSVLQDEANQTVVLIDKLLSQTSADVQRQTTYVANERANLAIMASAIKNGEMYGGMLGNVSMAPPGAPGAYAAAGAALVTIKFDRSDVSYQQILYTALAQALQSRPSAAFDVVAVSPTRGSLSSVQMAQTAAKRHAQDVFRSMTDMGVPATRLALSSATDPSLSASEVRVYVR